MLKRSIKRSIIYILLTAIFFILSYLFIDRGINTHTKEFIYYSNDNDLTYNVFLKDNDMFSDNKLSMNGSYITKLVDHIDFNFKFNNTYSDNLSGYYKYLVIAKLNIYEKENMDLLLTKEYTLLPEVVSVIDQNDMKKIKVNNSVTLDYNKYLSEINKFKTQYNSSVVGYIDLEFKLITDISFSKFSNVITDNTIINANIPLTSDIFKININNTKKKIDSYYDFSKRNKINYLFLILGALCISISLAILSVIIKELIDISNKESKYNKELKKILKQYNSNIVNIKKFYNKKKYNLIYVDSFDELMDVHNKTNYPISFRETKKNYESIFVIIDDDNAWIYRLVADKI